MQQKYFKVLKCEKLKPEMCMCNSEHSGPKNPIKTKVLHQNKLALLILSGTRQVNKQPHQLSYLHFGFKTAALKHIHYKLKQNCQCLMLYVVKNTLLQYVVLILN